MLRILIFVIVILVMALIYIYGLFLDKKDPTESIKNDTNNKLNNRKNNKSLVLNTDSIFSSTNIIKPTFQFSTEETENIENKKDFNINNLRIYDDLLIDDNKYYYDKELFVDFKYLLPENERFYFTILIDAVEEKKHKINFSKNIYLVTGEGDLKSNPLSFTISSISGDYTDILISRIRVLVNNMKNEIVYNHITPMDIIIEHPKKKDIEENKIELQYTPPSFL
jgi:hypothetical protein